jgi:O-antigen/teichoic acid export membrane protein
MSLAKKVALNTIIQIAGRILGLLIMLVTTNYIANHLVVDWSVLVGYGQYTIIFAYVSLIAVAADLGMFTWLVREMTGKSDQYIGDLVGTALAFRLLILFVSLGVISIFIPFMPYASEVKSGIIIGVIIAFSLLFSQVMAAIFQTHLVPNRIVVAETAGRLVVMLGTIYVLQRGMGLVAVIAAHLIGYSIIFFVSYWLARRLIPLRLRVNMTLLKEAIPEVVPIALVTILSLIHFKVDSLILSLYRTESEVGLYGIAYKLLDIIVIAPAIFAGNILPMITALYKEKRLEEFGMVIRRASSLLIAIAALLMVVTYFLAPWLIVYVSQGAFVEAQTPLRVLVFVVLFVFLADFFVPALISAHQQKRLIGVFSAATVFNIVLNLWAIPRYSYIGAAVTTVITESILVISILLIARKTLNVTLDFNVIARIMMAALLTSTGIALFQDQIIVAMPIFQDSSKLMQTYYLILAGVSVVALFITCLWGCVGGPHKLRELLLIPLKGRS